MLNRSKIGVIVGALLAISTTQARASCEVSVTPGNVTLGAPSISQFVVTNTGDQYANWVRIENPLVIGYSIAQLDAEGWHGSGGGTRADFAGGILESGASANFDLTLAETGELVSSIVWEASISHDAGDTFESCGSVNIAVDQQSAPSISDIMVVTSATSAKISWNTDVSASGIVEYGLDTSYGGTVENSAQVKSREVILNDLLPNVTYHYRLRSIASTGASGSTGDLTLTTGTEGVSTREVTTITNTVTQSVTSTITKIITDTTPPNLNIAQLTKKVYETSPIVNGSVVDDRGVARVEYRIKDREKNWSQASMNSVSGAKNVAFELLPPVTLDGTYVVQVRAVDLFGNTSVIKEQNFVIDLLPPTIGGGVISYGALPMEAHDGKVLLLENFLYEIVVYENGGAENVSLWTKDKSFELTKISNGLWRGNFELAAGDYQASFIASDGANNSTNREFANLVVKPVGKIDGEKLKVFWLDPTTKTYQPWEGEEYGMQSVGRVLPKGVYYLQTTKDGVNVVSQKLGLDRTTSIDSAWNIGKMSFGDKIRSRLGWSKQVRIEVPSFAKATEGRFTRQLVVSRESWIGKKSIVYIGTPWLPWYQETLRRAREWSLSENAQLVVLDEQGKDDPKGEWLKTLQVGLLPQVYLIDGKGDTLDYKEGIWER